MNKNDRELKLYRNKEWLENKYLKEKLSIYQIARICNSGHTTTICNWMRRYNIPSRSLSEAFHLHGGNHCNLSQEAIEWINGELLGDGCLISQSPYSANFQYSSKHKEYINYVSGTLKSFGINQSGKIRRSLTKNNHKYYVAYYYKSYTYAELLPIYKKWYPEGRKIIPKNIELTPIILRQHYIGDGNLQHQKNLWRKPLITLYTCGFSITDVKCLVEQLIDLGFKATRGISKNRINISTYSVKDFLDYIGKCPVKCYKYKWNLNGGNSNGI